MYKSVVLNIMIYNFEVRYMDLAEGSTLLDLPKDVSRLPFDTKPGDSTDLCPPDRTAHWIQSGYESGRLEPIETDLGFVGLYVSGCDTPVPHETFGTVHARRDFLFMVTQSSEQ